MSRRARLGVWLACLAALLMLPGTALAEFGTTPTNDLVPDGQVHAVTLGGDGKVYVGGSFDAVGQPVGPGLSYDDTLSTRDASLPKVSGDDGNEYFSADSVAVSIPDGAGGWYIGGDFTSVGGVARDNLAHILPGGTVDPNFDPEPDGPVQYLTLANGTLYLSGEFDTVDGQDRMGVAAVDPSTGVPTAFNANMDDDQDMCGLVVTASDVFICDNDARQIGGQTSDGFTEVTTTGAFVWAPTTRYGYSADVASIYLAPSGLLYVAGYCDYEEPDGSYQDGDAICAFQVPSGGGAPTMTSFSVDRINRVLYYEYPASVTHMVQIGNTLYCVGALTDVGVGPNYDSDGNYVPTESRGNGFALDVSNPDSPTLESWDPQANNPIDAMAELPNGTLAVGGDFTSLASTTAGHAAVLDPNSAAVVSADPQIGGEVQTIASAGSALYIGGAFSLIDEQPRANLAVFNADGSLSPLDPQVNGEVDALALSGSTLYAGGQFGQATGVGDANSSNRSSLAAFSTSDGSLLSFDPEPNSSVDALATDGTNLYVGGGFNQLNGSAHGGLAAFSLASGSLVPGFDPQPNGNVSSLALAGGRLYAGGSFSTLSGETGTPARSDIAAFDLPSLALDPFSAPAFDRGVNALAADGTTVYAGGDFDNVGSTYQPRLVALDAQTGALTGWDPQVSDTVFALGLDGSTLYAGGAFTLVGGQRVHGVVGLDTTSGAATAFVPNPDRDVFAIGSDASQLVIGGAFQNVGVSSTPNLALFPAGGNAPPGAGASSAAGVPTGAAGLTPAPDTAITSGPAYDTTNSTPTFAFTSDTGTSFQCSLDGAAFSACTSPLTTQALGPGSHTFTVRAVSAGGVVDPAGVTETFIELTAAQATDLSNQAPSAPELSNVTVTPTIKLGASLRGAKAPGFGFKLGSAAKVTVALQYCRGRRCTAVGDLIQLKSETAGQHRVAFSGTLGGAKLLAGRYRVTITAYAVDGAASAPATVSFRLVKASKPKLKPKAKPKTKPKTSPPKRRKTQ